MLGSDLVARLDGADVVSIDRDRVDITDPVSVRTAVTAADVVVNCAAFTAVDAAETAEAAAFDVNAAGPAHLARRARELGARIVHVSTDYVFDGCASQPYEETAPVGPRTAYGRTKAAGEWAVRAEAPDHLIVRTAWLYGASGSSFPTTIARLARERGEVSVVDDQVGQPTWTVDLADLIVRLVVAGAPAGSYHGTSSGEVSWFGFARKVVESAGLDPACVLPTTSAQFPRPAARPSYSVLGHEALSRIGVDPIGTWESRWEAAATTMLSV